MGALQADVVGGAAAERVEGLHDRYAPAIRRYCLRRLRSREESEDATQLVFLTAYRSLAEGVHPRSEGAWLFKIAENVVLQRRRAIARRARVEYAVDVDRIAESVAAPPPISAPELDGVREALASMPESQRQAIVLREWYGLSYREVADELGVSSTVVEGLIFRARRGLVRRLEDRNRLTRNGRRFGFLFPAEPLKLLFGGGGLGAKVVVGTASIAVVAAATHAPIKRLVLTADTARVAVTPAPVAPHVKHHRPRTHVHAQRATAVTPWRASEVVTGGSPARPPVPDTVPKARGQTVADSPSPAAVVATTSPADPPPGTGAAATAPPPDAGAAAPTPAPETSVEGSTTPQSTPDTGQPGPPTITPSGKTPPAVGRSTDQVPPGRDPAGVHADPPGIAGGTPPGHAADGTPPGLGADGTPPGHDSDVTPPGQASTGLQASS